MEDNKGLIRELPEFPDSDHVNQWADEWISDITEDNEPVLKLIEGIAIESSCAAKKYNDREIGAMNELIFALDKYAFEPKDTGLKKNILAVLSRTPKAKTGEFDDARTGFLNNSSKDEAHKIMRKVCPNWDGSPSP